ncbi:MAG: antitoxin family protein [Chloroflexota bacterium]
MTKTIVAVYDGDVFRPVDPLDLEPNVKYQVTIEPMDHEQKVGDAAAWRTLATLSGTIDAPADWSSEHDHYIYGTPKRHLDKPD